ncbi:MAG: MgtC/SapB family protein [Anaerolineae bacterium]|nr:MgtC/SapB family protein [Anaerolineae bacterium]
MADLFTVTSGDVIKLLAAFLIGGIIGAEREFHDKAAGLRTIILICVGACLFTIFSVKIATVGDPGRMAAQVVTGVGFIGAGVILHRQGQVRGLTTASTIWLSAALGVGVGIGYILFALLGAMLAVFILWGLPRVEDVLERARAFRVYRITTPLDAKRQPRVERIFQEAGLAARVERRLKHGDELLTFWWTAGKPEAHEKAVAALIAEAGVKDLEY